MSNFSYFRVISGTDCWM